MVLPLPLRVCAQVALGLGLATGCAGPRAAWMGDESDRILQTMKPEPFTDQTPGAQGIRLEDDAPPLAPPFGEQDDFITPRWQRRGWGGCCGYSGGAGHHLRGSFINRSNGLLP